MLNLLIVDDEIMIRKDLKRIISDSMGGFFSIVEASDGCEALNQINRKRIDIIITEIMIPKQDGLALIKNVYSLHKGARVIVLSGHSDYEYVRAAMKNGAVDYLLKPVESDVLIALLEQVALDAAPSRDPVAYAKNYVEKHYNEDITIRMISNLIHFNSAYFCQLFRKETGMTFTEFLTSHRIGMAKELFKSKDSRTSEVSAKVGYNDPNYFCRIFKKSTGMTPREYKKQVWLH